MFEKLFQTKLFESKIMKTFGIFERPKLYVYLVEERVSFVEVKFSR